MPRKKVPFSTDYPYHVTARCLNREWFGVQLDFLWEIFSEQLYFANRGFGIRIHSFVLMNNHFHLLCSSPDANLSQAMQYFMTQTSKLIGIESNRINHVYGSRHFRTLIKSRIYYEHAYKYVYRNPVSAGLVSRVEDYPWSTLQSLLGNSKGIIPLEEDTLLFGDTCETLKWLNQDYRGDDRDLIKTCLRKSEFQFSKIRIGRRWQSRDLETIRS